MNNKETYFSFTTHSTGGLLPALRNEATVIDGEKTATVTALWDTGATGTCVSTEVAKELSLEPSGRQIIKTPSGQKEVNTYLISVGLPNHVTITGIQACETEIGNQGIGLLIGMDIITLGDFSVTNYKGKTVFTYRIPSQGVIDFVQKQNLENLIGPKHGKGKRKK